MKIYYIDPELLPEVGTVDSSGIDLRARLDVTIQPFEYEMVPLNVIVDYSYDAMLKEKPGSFTLMVFPRSSLFKKTGCILANSVGIIDSDYKGPSDEVMACLFNTTTDPITISKGSRIAQMILVETRVPKFELFRNADNPNKDRGGIGSTGGYNGSK